MIETPQIVQTETQLIAFIPLVVAREDIQIVMGPGIQEVFAAIQAQNLSPTGPWFTHHNKRPDTHFDFKICVPIAKAIQPVGRVEAGELKATTVARSIYQGPYEELHKAWPELLEWVETNGHHRREDLWECYVVCPQPGLNIEPSAYRTELNQPLLS